MKVNSISVFTYTLLLFFAVLYFFAKGSHTVFEWITTQDIPFLLRLIDPDFLPNDFYTNSVVGSPRFLFSYIVYGLTQFGIDWHKALYFLKFLGIVIISPLLFLTMHKIFIKWKPKGLSLKGHEVIKFLFFLGSLGLLVFIQGCSSSQSPFGWSALQVYYFLSPMTLAFIVGLLYNLVSFDKRKIKYISPFLLLLSVLLHPVIGLCHFVISAIFLLPI